MSIGIQGEIGPEGPQGIQGEQGIQGLQGEAGPEGPQGIQGETGLQGDPGDPGADGLTSLVATSFEPPGINCADGGIIVDSGIDVDGSGVLDPAEIDDTVYVCNGAQGIQGLQGEAGPEGPQGIQGIQGEIGPEGPQGIQGETGPQGLQGEAGPQGDPGPQGTPGDPGADGLTSLIETTPEAEGANCENGGTKIDAGLDADGSGVLDPAEIESTFYACNGEQGLQGLQGPAGPQGEQGPQGTQGLQGEVGPEGPQGDAGPQGPQGPEGDPGADGVDGVSNWLRSSTAASITIGSNATGSQSLSCAGDGKLLGGACLTGNDAGTCTQLMGSGFTSDTTFTCTWRNTSALLSALLCPSDTFTGTVSIVCADVN